MRRTADCRITFATSHLSPLNFAPLGVAWGYIDPNYTVVLEFPYAMDTTVTPPSNQFSIIIDGVPKAPDSVVWDTPTILELAYQEALMAPTVLQLSFPVVHANFRSPQLFLVQPFLITGTGL